MTERTTGGPLAGLTIIEFVGIGPGPFCAMLLADMGADVVSIDRVTPHGLGIRKETRFDPTRRSRPSMALDLKSEDGRALALRILREADALLEGNRPGVMERLGLGPEDCRKVNPRLVYGRMTGWGQEGPMAQDVGHDLNYLALSGLLSMIGTRAAPAIPLNLMGDFAGGGLYLALGVLAALHEARASGQGQVVDAAMIDGLGSLMTHQLGYIASGRWEMQRESNFLDGGAPWYNVYETSDGLWLSVAAIEPRFYAALLDVMELDPATMPDQFDQSSWADQQERFAAIFASLTRDEWCRRMEGRDVCFAPVLSVEEAMAHPHLKTRGAYADVEGVPHPAPAPRFSRTPAAIRMPPHPPGADTDALLARFGLPAYEIETLRVKGVIA